MNYLTEGAKSSMFRNCLHTWKMLMSPTKNNSLSINPSRNEPFTIVVEGNIGSGKTSFLNYFNCNSNVITLTEPVKLWQNVKGYNLLDLMYKDCSKWGFTFQTYVQLTMLQIHELKVDKPIKMMERSIFSARYCFLENLYQAGLMPESQKIVLDEWFKWIVKRPSVNCDLIIYLRTTPDVVYERIQARSRREEKCVPLEYLARLHELHEDWLYHKTKHSLPSPVLVLDANKNLNEMELEYQQFELDFAHSKNI